MECEALGVKEALVHFQPFIKGEQNIVIMDHTTLQWAQTYENANHHLVAWGAVFRAYPGLEIVHRAGVVHSNVDPLSGLKRILLHQSLVKDDTLSLPEQPPDQPLVAWQSQIDKLPAEKAAFLTMRSQKARDKPKSTGLLLESTAPISTEEEMDRTTRNRGKLSNPPSKDFQPATHSITIGPTHLESFIKGYQEDPSFKKIWNLVDSNSSELKVAQWFYKSSNGLLIFRYTDWVAWLCIPH
jgi:RNase H-like domain found in reverse transcriptase